MALTDKLTAIGDAIRENTGGTELLTLNQMSEEIANIARAVKDVKINGASIVSEGVASIPLANTSTIGAVKAPESAQTSKGVCVDSNGQLFLGEASDSDLTNRADYKAISSANIDAAVKAALCDGRGIAWEDTEKEAARSRLGMDQAIVHPITLLVSGWDAELFTQTISVEGVSANEAEQFILITPTLESQADYYNAQIQCTAQGENSLTFTTSLIPDHDLSVYAMIQGVNVL